MRRIPRRQGESNGAKAGSGCPRRRRVIMHRGMNNATAPPHEIRLNTRDFGSVASHYSCRDA